MSSQQVFSDINQWSRHHNGVCPTCKVVFASLPPEANLVSHFYGSCQQQGLVAGFPAQRPVSSQLERIEKGIAALLERETVNFDLRTTIVAYQSTLCGKLFAIDEALDKLMQSHAGLEQAFHHIEQEHVDRAMKGIETFQGMIAGLAERLGAIEQQLVSIKQERLSEVWDSGYAAGYKEFVTKFNALRGSKPAKKRSKR